MFFTYLRQYRCRRYKLATWQDLEIIPTVKTQMVLGTNGSGKSSLLGAGFSVTLPDMKKDYHKGGFRTIRLNHNGHHYELHSSYEGKSPEHSFIRDGEELNIGKTGTVYEALVREHFGMDRELEDVLNGSTKFTEMSPIERRNWITRLSSADFTYALDLYNKTKKGIKYAESVVKRNSERLAEETGKLLNQDDAKHLLDRCNTLRDELNILLQESNQGVPAVYTLMGDLTQSWASITEQVDRISKNIFYPPEGFNWTDPQQLFDDIQRRNNELRTLEGQLNTLGEEFGYLETKMEHLRTIEGLDEAFVRQRVAELNAQIEECLRRLCTGLNSDHIAHRPEDIEVVQEFMSKVRNLGFADEWPKHLADKAHETTATLTESIQKAFRTISNIEGRLEHIDKCQSVGCPKCGHEFKQGVDGNERENLLVQLEKGRGLIKTWTEQLAVSTDYANKDLDYRQSVESARRIQYNHPELSSFWQLIASAGGVDAGPALLPTCQMYLRDAHVAAEIAKLEYELRPVKEALDTIEKTATDGNTIRERYYLLKNKITTITEQMSVSRLELAMIEGYKRQLELYDESVRSLEEQLQNWQEDAERLVEAIRQDEIKKLIGQQQSSLAVASEALAESELIQGVVNDIQREIKTMSVQEKAYRLLESLFSPNDGLIAEQLSLSINTLLDRMNAVIARIWGYNMAVMPCSLEDGSLNYRFPLYALTTDDPVPDIKLGSDSQKSIVNLAFRLVVYKFLKLQHYPLYLDELGRDFDPVHRHNLIPAIKDLIDDDTYSQVFMISHYEDGQSSFKNSEIVVLHDSHLTITADYNQHVRFA